jgi:hypothetical protein
MVERAKTQVEGFRIQTIMYSIFIHMKELLEAVLVDPSARTADAAEQVAIAQSEFLTWQ